MSRPTPAGCLSRIRGALLTLVPFALLLTARAALAQTSPARARPVAQAVLRAGPIHLDGHLDEAAWAGAPVVSDFTQVDPHEGQPVSERTEVRILYDREALYIGVRAYDTGPVTARLGRRDMALSDADWFGVVIDSYHDHRTAFSFDVNPAGVRRDAVKSTAGGGEQDDLSWDGVWDAAASIDGQGWSAEYRIPFSQLRFNDQPVQRWGLQLERVIGRKREYAVSSFTPKAEPGGIPTYGHLEGIEGIEPGDRLELLPYVLARGEFVDPGVNPFRTDREGYASAGLDLRFRVSSDVSLVAAINPDFGQVEVDPAVINLTVYETFFDEKRPFFIEGSEIFDFGRNTSGGQLFYSRRIGRAPQLRAPTPFADIPTATNILGAAKLAGKSAGGWSFGLIEAVTGREEARYRDAEGATGRVVVEPLANYLVARARRDLRQGRSSFGAMVTSMKRELDGETSRATLRSSAWAGGVDFRHESASRAWILRGSAAASRVAGSPEALVRVQRAGNHFFQRPDADHLEVDPDATSLTGYSIGAAVARQGGEHWRGELALAATSPKFEVNDLGFQTRTDRRDAQLNLTYLENQPGSFFRNYALTAAVRYEHNYDWERVSAFYALVGSFRHLGFWGGGFQIFHSVRALDDRSTRGGPLMERPAGWRGSVALTSDGRKDVTLNGSVGATTDAYGGWSSSIGLGVGVKTSSRWNFSIGPSFSRGVNRAQYVGTVPGAGPAATFGAAYLFAPLEQTTLAMETRLNVTFTPDLSLELYAQPFISTGDYGDVGSLAAPRGYTFDAFEGTVPDRDFSFRSLRGNAVLRWEWRPGSTLFFAWQQSRSDFELGDGQFDFSADQRALFRAQPDNIFLLKINYWIAP